MIEAQYGHFARCGQAPQTGKLFVPGHEDAVALQHTTATGWQGALYNEPAYGPAICGASIPPSRVSSGVEGALARVQEFCRKARADCDEPRVHQVAR